MAEENNQESQKTLVAFVVGLLIGGMLVWAFSGPSADAPKNDDNDEVATEELEDADSGAAMEESSDTTEDNAQTLEVGDGSVDVSNQPAGTSVLLGGATFPISEGWIGIREYDNDNLGYILGVVRFSESANLVPAEIILQRPTTAGRQYAVVIFTENGDNSFNLATDVQIDEVFGTFTAQ